MSHQTKNQKQIVEQELIRNQIEEIEHLIKLLHDKERKIQKECSHPDVNKEYGSDTGNWDPSADSYWVNYTCPDCKKSWRVYQ